MPPPPRGRAAETRARHAGIVVRFESREAEVAYQTHAHHVRVRDGILKPLLDTAAGSPLLAMDYEHAQTSES